MRKLSAAVFAAWGVLAVLAVPAGAQSPGLVDASVVCSARHQFGAKPVDVVKTADGAAVLATTSWNWHDAIGCYLTLDDQATAALRATDPPSSLPTGVSAASQLCSDHHQFGREPVDVAKTANGNTVLARLVWNWHDQIGCYLTLDPEAVGTLQAAHAAANAPDPTPDQTPDPTPDPTPDQTPDPTPDPTPDQTPDPDDNGDPPPRPAVPIAVPESEPSGRCASAVSAGVYQWEQCAWAEYWEDTDYNYSLSDREAAALIARIWAEVDVVGKAASPPTNALIPAGSLCATATDGGFIIGCYQPSLHHIRRLDAFLKTLLHETAHALAANHPSIAPCRSLTDNDEYQACAHNDIFRCVANHLYVAYAGIPDAGVCGTAPEQQPPGSQQVRWTSTSDDDGTLHAFVDADWHTRPTPYEDSMVGLVVRCQDGSLSVYIWFDEGRIDGDANEKISVVHVFIPEGFSEWGSERQREYIADHRVDARWHESTTNQSVFLPENLRNGFLGDMASHDAVLVQAWNADNTVFGLMSFPLNGSHEHINPVEDQCDTGGGSPSPECAPMASEGWCSVTGTNWARFSGSDTDALTGRTTVTTWSSVGTQETGFRYPWDDEWASLNVRCRDSEFAVWAYFGGQYVAGQYALNDRIPIQYRFDDTGTPTSEAWGESTTNEGAFASDPQAFARRLAASEKLVLRAWNFDDDVIGTLVFDTTGAEFEVRHAMAACGLRL